MILTLTLNPALDALVFLEHLQIHAKNVSVQKNLFASGKGFNVAKALSALSVPVTGIGFVGRADVDRYEHDLGARGILLAITPISGTRTNFKLIERDTGLETEINEPGFPASDQELAALRQSLTDRLDGADWLVLSGSVAPGVPPGIYADLIRQGARAGVRTLLDSSGNYLRAGVAARPTVIRINRTELGEATEVDTDSTESMATAAQGLLIGDTEMVVVSLGKQGALLVNRRGRWIAQPPRLNVVNAIGAGDVMSAGVVQGWQRGLEAPLLLRWSTALASASVLTLESGEVNPNVARELESGIDVHPL